MSNLKVFAARDSMVRRDAADAPAEIIAYLDSKPWVRQRTLVVAAKSRAAAGRAFGIAPHHFDGCCLSETGNAAQIAQALTEPGVVFWKPLDYRGPEWVRQP